MGSESSVLCPGGLAAGELPEDVLHSRAGVCGTKQGNVLFGCMIRRKGCLKLARLASAVNFNSSNPLGWIAII